VSGADLRGTLLSFAYVLVVLLVADFIRRRVGVSAEATRKGVHIAVGMWIFPTLLLFEHWTWSLLPPLIFAALNALSLRYRFFGAIEVAEPTLGTVYFPLSFALLLGLFWPIGRPEITAAGLMAMTWGDAMASVVGQAFARQGYRVWRQHKTWLGSLAFFSWALLSVTVTLRLLGGYPPPRALLHAALTGLVGAVVEAISPKGTDNLTVPIVTAGLLYLL
jgi:phytol kinase